MINIFGGYKFYSIYKDKFSFSHKNTRLWRFRYMIGLYSAYSNRFKFGDLQCLNISVRGGMNLVSYVNLTLQIIRISNNPISSTLKLCLTFGKEHINRISCNYAGSTICLLSTSVVMHSNFFHEVCCTRLNTCGQT